MHLPFEVENQAYSKPIWSDGCDTECVAAGGSFSDKAVHQIIPTYESLQLVVNGPFEDLTRLKNS